MIPRHYDIEANRKAFAANNDAMKREVAELDGSAQDKAFRHCQLVLAPAAAEVRLAVMALENECQEHGVLVAAMAHACAVILRDCGVVARRFELQAEFANACMQSQIEVQSRSAALVCKSFKVAVTEGGNA